MVLTENDRVLWISRNKTLLFWWHGKICALSQISWIEESAVQRGLRQNYFSARCRQLFSMCQKCLANRYLLQAKYLHSHYSIV